MSTKEIHNPLIEKYESVFLSRIVKLLYPHFHPDMATFLAILSAATSFVLYIGATKSPINYILICFFIAVHYIFDGIDGKMANLKKMDRKIGRYIDKISDFICSLFFITGLMLSVNINLIFMFGPFLFFGIVYFLYLYYYLSKKIDIKIGGTESRLLLMVINLILFFHLI